MLGAYAQVHEYRNVTKTLEERTQGEVCLGSTGTLQGTYTFSLLHSGNKITRGQFAEVTAPTIIMKRVAAMALAKKQNEGLIFEKRTGATVNNILPDDKVNEAFNKIDRNIAGVDWEAEIQEVVERMPQLNNSQYASLVGDEDDDKNRDDQENDNESTGAENDGKITGVQHNAKITGVDSDNENTGVKS